MAITSDGKNRIMIFGPKNDGTYVIELKTDPALLLEAPRCLGLEPLAVVMAEGAAR